MPGYASIFLVGEHENPCGKKVHDYQFSYALGGNSFAGTLGEEKLHHFLASELGLPKDDLERIMRDLREARHSTIPALDSPEHETAALGWSKLPLILGPRIDV